METEVLSIRATWLSRVDTFCEANNFSPTEFSRQATGNHRQYSRWKKGVGSLEVIERAEDFMNNYDAESGTDVGASGTQAA